jgi:hypothetical protein
MIRSSGNQTELAKKEANLIAAIEKMLPDFARACRAHDTQAVIMHQDAFAADYQDEEYRVITVGPAQDAHSADDVALTFVLLKLAASF